MVGSLPLELNKPIPNGFALSAHSSEPCCLFPQRGLLGLQAFGQCRVLALCHPLLLLQTVQHRRSLFNLCAASSVPTANNKRRMHTKNFLVGRHTLAVAASAARLAVRNFNEASWHGHNMGSTHPHARTQFAGRHLTFRMAYVWARSLLRCLRTCTKSSLASMHVSTEAANCFTAAAWVVSALAAFVKSLFARVAFVCHATNAHRTSASRNAVDTRTYKHTHRYGTLCPPWLCSARL